MINPRHILPLVVVVLMCCVEPFNIQSIGSSETLVVEGYISTELKQHEIVISRTSAINKQEFLPETGATASIKEGSGLIPLSENKPGHYLTPPMKGTVGQIYQLQITTKNGKQLVSEEVTLKDTPEITDIYATYTQGAFEESNGSFQIYLDTEDATNTSKYFRWEFIETWQIQTPFESDFAWLGGNNVVFRTTPVSTCYPSDSSASFLIQSVKNLSQSKITGQLIQSMQGDSQKMGILYSILVRQFTLSETGYLYWQSLRKINETQGSLYDVQPGTVVGNLSVVGSTEVVLGYFDAGTVKEKRAFFKPRDFTQVGFTPVEFGRDCEFLNAIQIPLSRIGAFLSANPGLEITGATGFNDPTLFLLPIRCCDCTNIGTNIKPDFWP